MPQSNTNDKDNVVLVAPSNDVRWCWFGQEESSAEDTNSSSEQEDS